MSYNEEVPSLVRWLGCSIVLCTKGFGAHPPSAHIPRLRVPSLAGESMGGGATD